MCDLTLLRHPRCLASLHELLFSYRSLPSSLSQQRFWPPPSRTSLFSENGPSSNHPRISTKIGPDDLKVRPLYVDTRLKEFTFGIPHEVTEQLFVVRRVVRVNDTLPQEALPLRWSWQRSGWLVVDRVTGHISQASLPEFDPDSSSGQLVPRLRRLLRNLGRWPQAFCRRDATWPPQTHPEKASGRSR